MTVLWEGDGIVNCPGSLKIPSYGCPNIEVHWKENSNELLLEFEEWTSGRISLHLGNLSIDLKKHLICIRSVLELIIRVAIYNT